MTKKEICERYLKVYSAAVCDVLDGLGFTNQAIVENLHPVTFSAKLVGYATTAKGTPTSLKIDPTNNYGLKFVDGLLEDQIVVIDAAGDRSSAHWGELMSTAAKSKGCRGALILGGIRDVEKIVELGFPVFYQHKIPTDINGRWNYIEFGIPIVKGNVTIHQDDFILGDLSGVVVIPNSLVMKVLLEAEEIVRVEHTVREKLKRGESPLEVFKIYGKF